MLLELHDFEEHEERDNQTINSDGFRERHAEDHVGQQVTVGIGVASHTAEGALHAQTDSHTGACGTDHRQTRAVMSLLQTHIPTP